jgi:hypothetical protein
MQLIEHDLCPTTVEVKSIRYEQNITERKLAGHMVTSRIDLITPVSWMIKV